MKKGDKNEAMWSEYYHNRYIPFLVSSKILRELDAGQIDIAYLEKKAEWSAVLVEVKSSQYPSALQWRRLRKSQDYLSKVIERVVELKVKFCQKDFDSLS